MHVCQIQGQEIALLERKVLPLLYLKQHGQFSFQQHTISVSADETYSYQTWQKNDFWDRKGVTESFHWHLICLMDPWWLFNSWKRYYNKIPVKIKPVLVANLPSTLYLYSLFSFQIWNIHTSSPTLSSYTQVLYK